MFKNFKLRFKDNDLKELLWNIALATNIDDFKRAMADLERADPQHRDNLIATSWLKRLPLHFWSRAHYGTSAKIDILVNNLNESFNNHVFKARSEPIVTLLEF